MIITRNRVLGNEYGYCRSCGYEGNFPILADSHGDEHVIPPGRIFHCPNCLTCLSDISLLKDSREEFELEC